LTNNHPSATTHGVLVECPTLLVTLYRHDANTPAQHRTQLGVAEFADLAVIDDVVIDLLRGFAFQAIGNLLERPTLLVLDRALEEPFGEPIHLPALLLVVRIDSVQF
jgi:hypothetical protein